MTAAAPGVCGLEVSRYPTITGACMSVPETYTCFTLVDAVEGDVELISRGVRAPCEAGSVTVGQPGEAWVLRPRTEMLGAIRILRVYDDLGGVLRDELGVRAGVSAFRRGPQRIPGIDRHFARLYDAVDHGEPLEAQGLLLPFLRCVVGITPGAYARAVR